MSSEQHDHLNHLIAEQRYRAARRKQFRREQLFARLFVAAIILIPLAIVSIIATTNP